MTQDITTIDQSEIAKFEKIANEWWDSAGKFKPLHKINPVRLEYIIAQIKTHYAKDGLVGLSIIDIGCGGGLIAEPLARLGATVTGIDASSLNIEVAKLHAKNMGVCVKYKQSTAEELVDKDVLFDVVLALEILEHVADVPHFIASCSRLLKPGGIAIFSTLSRTAKSYILAIIGAEYVLNWLPRGTHDWNKFIKPSELARHLRENNLSLAEQKGLEYKLQSGNWYISENVEVNYLAVATKAP